MSAYDQQSFGEWDTAAPSETDCISQYADEDAESDGAHWPPPWPLPMASKQ